MIVIYDSHKIEGFGYFTLTCDDQMWSRVPGGLVGVIVIVISNPTSVE